MSKTKFFFVGIYQRDEVPYIEYYKKVILATDAILADLEGICQMDADMPEADYVILGSFVVSQKDFEDA